MPDTDSTLRGPISKKLKEFTVVDMDVHIHETPAALAPYCEMPWRKSLEHLSTVPQRYLDIPGFSPNLSVYPSFPDSGGDRRSTVSSASQMRQDLDSLGIDIGVLFPDALLSHASIKNTDYAVALARAYNRWMVEEWLDSDFSLKGAILAPHHDPHAAAGEIMRYAGHANVVAIYLPTSCVDPLYGHRRYDPIYNAAQDTGLPVTFHSVGAIHPVFPFNLQGFETGFANHIISHPFSLISNLVSLMETGVPVRFPNLRIVFTEGGIGWVPWIMLRMDKEYQERRRDIPFLKDRPSTYVKKMYFATQPIEEPEHMADMATFISLFDGEDSVVFASDWPHHDFDHPNKVLQIPVEDKVLRKIMGGNAIRLLNLNESVT
ncbi:MAG: amidohydrolase [Anaerolineales bacterium]|nr:amidohydrolase [Anaerolineales bacterium]